MPHKRHIPKSKGWVHRALSCLLAGLLRLTFRPFIGAPFPIRFQRFWANTLSLLMFGTVGVSSRNIKMSSVPARHITPATTLQRGAILYFHGGAFCLGSHWTHRAITSRLAKAASLPIYSVNYRLAPEHPAPAALNDALSAFQYLLTQGHQAKDIVIAGDSAGGNLALELTLALGKQQTPAALLLVSPFVDAALDGDSLLTNATTDPMLRIGWLQQALNWYRPQTTSLLEQDLSHLPPTLIQSGSREILLSDSERLAEQLSQHGVEHQLEIYQGLWHDFHLQAFYLPTARNAIRTLGRFAHIHVL